MLEYLTQSRGDAKIREERPLTLLFKSSVGALHWIDDLPMFLCGPLRLRDFASDPS